jgi:hypothetical protein
MSKRFAFVMALLPALVLAGCGSDDVTTPPVPDTTPPLAPVILGATQAGDVVNLWWQPNTEADLHGYFVYIADGESFGRLSEDPMELAYAAIPRESCNGALWVTAVDRSGNESAASASLNPTTLTTQVPDRHLPKDLPSGD